MQTINTKSGHTIVFYDAIDEMPMVRYHKYNQMMVIGCGAGIELEDIKAKIAAIEKLVVNEMCQKAAVEVCNLRMQLAMVSSGIDVKSRALAALVKSIDGEDCNNLSSDGLKATAERLDEILIKEERDTSNEGVKKKIDGELRYYFPQMMDEDHARLNLVKERLRLMLDEAINESDNKEKIDSVERRIMERVEVRDYSQYERESEIAYEQGCQSMNKQLHTNAKGMTVLEYYSATQLLEEQAKKLEQVTNKHK